MMAHGFLDVANKNFISLSRKIARQPEIQAMLGGPVKLFSPFKKPSANSIVLAWGFKPSAFHAVAYSSRYDIPLLRLEDGFLRSLGLGVSGAAPLSIVLDDLSIYYDGTQPSRLEQLIRDADLDPVLMERVKASLELLAKFRLSKYNHAPSVRFASAVDGVMRILVVDQTVGDISVCRGGADRQVFQAMLDAARSDHSEAEIYIKTHPDVISGRKIGYLGFDHDDRRVRLIAQDICPLSLLEQVDKVYVVTSQMGFEALMLKKTVVCFGLPWYAGWGLTDDRHPGMAALRERRNVKRTLEELFAAAYLQYPRYIDPATGKPGTIFDVIDWLARNKQANDATRGELWCVGMSMWKRAIVRPFLESPSTKVRFVRSAAALARQRPGDGARVVIWGVGNEQAVQQVAAANAMPVWRMEDGFLRSVGLGSDLYRPVSLVLDRGGMYYDPASGSELETMLATQVSSKEELQRAARFISSYVSMRASKYNIGGKPLQLAAGDRRVLLVPGQVEGDASIQRGSPVIASNLALLRKVRSDNPEAYIVFKPHPDVVAGNRRGAIDLNLLNGLADHHAPDASIIDCIEAADEVHTMTSLSGFEALLHGRVVHCYGGPFYAGWGLTVDHFPLGHRQRELTLEELVLAAFLKYPRYALPGMPGLVSAEHALDLLTVQAAGQEAKLGQNGLHGWFSRKLRKATALARMLHGSRKSGAARV